MQSQNLINTKVKSTNSLSVNSKIHPLTISLLLINIALLSVLDHPFHVLAFCVSVLLAFLFKSCFGGKIKNFIPYFLEGYFICCIAGSIFCLYWYYRSGSVYPDGTFKDYLTYMRYSKLSLADYFKSPKFNEPGFYLVNHGVRLIAMFTGKDTYLLHLQVLFCAGGLLRCYILAFIKQVIGVEPDIVIRRFLLVFPLILLFSSGVLIRDQIIALFITIAVVNFAAYLNDKRNWLIHITRVGAVIVLLYFFRTEETVTIIAIFLLSQIAFMIFAEKRMVRKITSVFLAVCILFGAQTYLKNSNAEFEGKQTKMQNRIARNAAKVDPNSSSSSLGTQLLQSENPIKYLLLPGYNLLIYFPFFSGWVVDNEIQIMSVVGGLGGLVWQLLLGMWVVGLKKHWQRRSQIDFLCLTGMFVFVVSIALIVPDMRYTYPGVSFMLGSVALGKEMRSEIKRRWPFVILCLYILYLFLKGF